MKSPGFTVFFCLISWYANATSPVLPIEKITTTPAAQFVKEGTMVSVRFGTNEEWPHIWFHPKGGNWDLSDKSYLSFSVENLKGNDLNLRCRIDNPGSDGKKLCLYGNIKLKPKENAIFTVELPCPLVLYGSPLTLNGMNIYPSQFDARKISGVQLFVDHPSAEQAFKVSIPSAGGEPLPSRHYNSEKFLPFIDRYGQFKHEDWPDKIHSDEDFNARRQAEAEELKRFPDCSVPGNELDIYGGWLNGPKLKTSKFFRVEKYAGKWYFVDPQGNLFWSLGINDVRPSGSFETPTALRENYFEDLPKQGDPMFRFFSSITAPEGFYKGMKPFQAYSFGNANLFRKYGENWRSIICNVNIARVKSWGVNTYGNWSSLAMCKLRTNPYVATIHTVPQSNGIKGYDTWYWGAFHDMFAPEFRSSVAKEISQKNDAIGDPWCIGFFIENEINWGYTSSLARSVLTNAASQPAKQAMTKFFQNKYGSIEKLNAVWKTNYASWDDFLKRTVAACEPAENQTDMDEFYQLMAETYYRIVKEELARLAPGQLYLGSRFAICNSIVARAAAKYCDVVSYNRYVKDVSDLQLPEGCDKPIIIGEFHFGAPDRGVFGSGVSKKAKNQNDRALMFASYIKSALDNPAIVGAHWYTFNDQCCTGRNDNENYLIGFIDVCDTPHKELVETCRNISRKLYKERVGSAEAVQLIK